MKSFCIALFAILALAAELRAQPVVQYPQAPATIVQPDANAQGGQPPQATNAQPQPNPNLDMMPQLDGIEGNIYANIFEKYWFFILLGLLLAATGAYYLFRPRKKAPPTPFEHALSTLVQIEKNGGSLSAKEYARQISSAIRVYIVQVHQIPAPERTTEEFLRIAARSLAFDKMQRGQLEKILKLSDMAKFAMHSFRDAERRELLAEATEFLTNDNKKSELVKKMKEEHPIPDDAQDKKSADSEKIELSDGEK